MSRGAGFFLYGEKGSFSLESAVILPVIILIVSCFIVLCADIVYATYSDGVKSMAEETDYIDETETDRVINTVLDFIGDIGS